MTVKIIIL